MVFTRKAIMMKDCDSFDCLVQRMGKGETAVVVDGFNVSAGNAIDGRDRKRVDRMCRHLDRPPIATERLTETGDGDELRYELKKAWRDGIGFVRLDPYELLARICAMVPPPQETTVPNPMQLALFGGHFDESAADGSTRARLARGPPKRKKVPLGQLLLPFSKMRQCRRVSTGQEESTRRSLDDSRANQDCVRMRPSAQFRRCDAGRRKRVSCKIGGLFGLGTRIVAFTCAW